MSFPTTNSRADGKLQKWKKILGVLQNAVGALSGNDPKRADGLRITKLKVLRALRGIQPATDPAGQVTADSTIVTVDSTTITVDNA